MFSNSHRRLSFQRCSTNCQGQVLLFTPKTFVPALLQKLSRTGSPIHTEDFRSSAAPPTVKDGSPIHTEDFRSALLHQLSRTGCPIHTKDFRSSAAPPTVKDNFAQALLHELSRTSSSRHTEDPALLQQLSRTGSPIHTEDFRSSAAPPTVKDRISNSHRDLRSSAVPPNVKDRISNSHRRLSSWKLFLLGFLHADLNGEDYELRVLLRQVLLSAFLQELGSVLLQAPNHSRSSVDPSMDNLCVFCVK